MTPDLLAPIRQINTGAAPAGQTLLSQFHAKAPSYTIVKVTMTTDGVMISDIDMITRRVGA